MGNAGPIIKSDLYRYDGSTSRKLLIFNLIFSTGFRYSYCLRKCAEAARFKKKGFGVAYLFWGFILWKIGLKYHIHISPRTKIGDGLFIVYGENITITGDAIIGKNLTIHHGAVIGSTPRGKRRGAPSIGDNVFIGAYAVIVGKVYVGNNVLIAPLTHVNFDVPDNAVVAGNRGKIISFSGTEERYVGNRC